MVNTDIKFQIHKKSYDKRPEIRMKIKNSNRNKEKAKSKKANCSAICHHRSACSDTNLRRFNA